MAKSNLKASNSVFLTLASLGGDTYTGSGGASNRISDAADLYARVPLVWRAGRIRCNALQAIPRYVYAEGTDTQIDWTFDLKLSKLYWLLEAALLFSGHALVVKNANRYGYTATDGLQWLNPFTLSVEWRGGQRYFCQHVNGKRYPANGWWSEDEVIYIREFSFKEDISAGDCAAGVALGDGQLAHYMTRMASVFFENGAMPATLITKEGGFGADTEQVTAFFQRFTSGLRNFARTLALRGAGVEVHTIQSAFKDLAMPELEAKATKGVANAFEMPAVFLDSDETFASSQAALKKMLYDETVIPRSEMFDEEITKQLGAELGFYVASKPDELDLYKEDEVANMEAASLFLDILNKATTFPEWLAAIETLGIDVSEENKKVIEKSFADKEAKAEADKASEREIQLAKVQQPVMPMPEDTSAKPSPLPPQKSLLDADLAKWERAALKRITKGGDLGFNSDVIPKTLAASIHGALEAASGADDVRGVFANAARWANYP